MSFGIVASVAATVGGAAISANASSKAAKAQAEAAGEASDATLQASRESIASIEDHLLLIRGDHDPGKGHERPTVVSQLK